MTKFEVASRGDLKFSRWLPNQRYRIFFFPGIVYRHSLTRFSRFLFLFFFHFWGKKKIQPQILVTCYVFFFFLRKSLKSTHSLKFRTVKKKNSPVKKKTGFSLTQSIFSKMWSKLNYSGEKKNTIPLVPPYLFLLICVLLLGSPLIEDSSVNNRVIPMFITRRWSL